MIKLNFYFFLLFSCLYINVKGQQKPKLVVGIVIDQMRWDYIYKYKNRYGANGFNKIVANGFSNENTFIPYAPTVTAAGHSCIYTGSVPALNGIVGNAWYNKTIKKMVYCTDDSTVYGVGGDMENGKMSPRNMLSNTITDELKIATNFASKVVGICIKDRGSILPAGHSADAAYWYDSKTGNWITSTYYTNELPRWVNNFNAKKYVDMYYAKNWNTSFPINTYTLSTTDEKPYEGKLKGAKNTSFPHNLTEHIGKDYGVIAGTPYGNSLTLQFAKDAIYNMKLGKSKVTDFLALSLSSTDYVGHRNGPNSIEIEDTYIKLDADLASFLEYLDTKIGKNEYTLFITADHGVANIPGFLKEHKIPAGSWDNELMVKKLNNALYEKFNANAIISRELNYQLYINDDLLKEKNILKNDVIQFCIAYCKKELGIAHAFALENIEHTALQSVVKEMLINGYNNKRSGDIQIVLEPGWVDGNGIGTTHGLWNPYDSHIPMLWYGKGVKKGKSYVTRYMSDIAPTLAALLQIQMPNSSVGNVMTEVIQ
jgi:predicted AlkP superfamily pyrophosphatase or phosphodiesterase